MNGYQESKARLQRFDERQILQQVGDAVPLVEAVVGAAEQGGEARLHLAPRQARLGAVAALQLIEVGERWSDGRLSVADEHLLSGLMRNLLTGLMRTRAAQANLHAAGKNTKSSKDLIDSASAVEILQRAVDILKAGREAGKPVTSYSNE